MASSTPKRQQYAESLYSTYIDLPDEDELKTPEANTEQLSATGPGTEINGVKVDSSNVGNREQELIRAMQNGGNGFGGRGGRGASISKLKSLPKVKDNIVSEASGNSIGNIFNSNYRGKTEVSKAIRGYSISEDDIATMIRYMKTIADNTGLSSSKLDMLNDLNTGGTSNQILVSAGNGQPPLSNYSTKADNTSNATSKRNYSTAAKVATGGLS